MFGSFKAAKCLALTATAAAAILVGAAPAPQSFAAQQPAKTQITAAPVTRPAATELAWLRTEMAMPAERSRILADLQTALQGVGKVGVGPLPGTTAKQDVTPDISYGHDLTHFWVTASYADIADGAIYAAIGACAFILEPLANVCEIAGETLVDWSRGWGGARPPIMASGPRSTGSRRTSPGGRW
jgi:hypothetical protein